MKDLASLMLDLAYFAFLTMDKTLTDLVLKIEEEVSTLNYFLIMNTTLAVRDKDDAEAGTVIINMGTALNAIANAAADIAQLTKLNIEPHLVLKKALEETEEVVKSYRIDKRSPLIGKKIEELEKLGFYVDIIAIKRAQVWILNPPMNFKLNPEDVIVCRGNREALSSFAEVCKSGRSN